MEGKAYSLYVMLPIFGIIGLITLLSELTSPRTPYLEEAGARAAVPHSPAEFVEVLDSMDPLEGLGEAHGLYPTPAPPLNPDYWPCSDCHVDQDPADRTRRELTDAHDDIVLQHDEENRWCLDCHDFANRDFLRLASGRLIPFEESHQLCGQCHGTIYRDWKVGIHGRRTGYWNGSKRYLLCVHCHWPHAPAFDPLEPLPPPVRPEFLSPGSARGEAELTDAGSGEEH